MYTRFPDFGSIQTIIIVLLVHINTFWCTYHQYILLKRRSTVRSRDNCLYYVWLGTCWWIQIKNATKQNYALSVNFCWRVLINKPETMKSLTFRDQYYPHARVRSGNMDLEGAKSKSIKKSYIFVVNPLRGLQWTAATPTRPGMSFMLFFPRHIIFLSDTLGRHSLYGCMLQSVWWMWKVPTLASCCPAL